MTIIQRADIKSVLAISADGKRAVVELHNNERVIVPHAQVRGIR